MRLNNLLKVMQLVSVKAEYALGGLYPQCTYLLDAITLLPSPCNHVMQLKDKSK